MDTISQNSIEITVLGQVVDISCPDYESPPCADELYRNPYRCDQYYQCTYACLVYNFNCSEGLHFDDVNNICVFPSQLNPPCEGNSFVSAWIQLWFIHVSKSMMTLCWYHYRMFQGWYVWLLWFPWKSKLHVILQILYHIPNPITKTLTFARTEQE